MILRHWTRGAVLPAALALVVGCAGTNESEPTAAKGQVRGELGYFMLVDGSLAVVDMESMTKVTTIKVGHHPVHQVAALPDNRTLYTGDLDNGKILKLTVSPDGESYTSQVVADSPVRLHAFFASRDGRKVAVTSTFELEATMKLPLPDLRSDAILIIDTETDTVSAPIALQSPAAAEFSRDGKTLYVTNAHHQTLSVVDVATGKETQRIALGTAKPGDIGPDGVAISADGQWLATADFDLHTVSVMDTATLTRRTIQYDTIPHDVRFSPDSKELWVVDYARHPNPGDEVANASIPSNIASYDVATLTSQKAIAPEVTTQRVTMAGGSSLAYFTTAVGGVVTYDRDTGALKSELVVGGLGNPVVCGMVTY